MFGVGGSSGGHVHMNELRQDGVEGGGGGADLTVNPRLDQQAAFGKYENKTLTLCQDISIIEVKQQCSLKEHF